MSEEPYYLRGPNVMISGVSGAAEEKGGKTVLANWWYYNAVLNHTHPEIGFFFNPKGEKFIKGKTVRSLKEIRTGLQNGQRLFDVRVPEGIGPLQVHERLVRFVRNIKGTKIFVHDEAYNYGGSDLLEWCLRQGGNIDDSEQWKSGSIQSIVVSQHPWDIKEKVIQNATVKIWVGPVSGEATRYFQVMGIENAIDSVREFSGPYKWSVMDGGEYIETNDPVPQKFAEG